MIDAEYCTCKNQFTGGVQLVGAGECDLGEYAQGCGECLRPHIMYYERFWKDCPECGATVTSLWEELCARCVRRDPFNRPDSEPYKSWSWAIAAHKKYQEMLLNPLTAVV